MVTSEPLGRRFVLDQKFDEVQGMRYPEFRAQGYQIGSGTIESGCKRVIGARLKRAGMIWTLQGARQVIKARAMFLSNEWDDFCQRRQPVRRTYSRAA